MRVKINVTAGPAKGQNFIFNKPDCFLFGRTADAWISLPNDPYVSRQHFLLEISPSECKLIDLNSRNGTFVNGVRYGGRKPSESGVKQAPDGVKEVLLKDGDEISVGDTHMRVSIQGTLEKKLREVTTRVYKCLRKENRYPQERRETQYHYEGIVGQHPALQKTLRLVEMVAATDTRVLLVGESGTGKEVIAQMIHRRSLRQSAPFFAINCGALTESLLESELFGHEQGAFTGAVSTKKGIFEAAKGGTLFLDEVAETSSAFQLKLLRVVEKGEFFRVGGIRPIKTDVRLISASNRDLRKAVADRRFREDLFYRLSVVQIHLPPLRERREDIPLLTAHFLAIHSRRLKKKVKGIRPDAMEALTRYSWPGNIRELQNVIERAVIMVGAGEEILPEHLPFNLLEKKKEVQDPTEDLKDAEREIIIKTLKECNWNRSLAAKRLGIGRRTLYDKLARLEISLESLIPDD